MIMMPRTRPLSLLIVDDSTVIRSRITRLVSSPQLPLIQIAGLAANGEMALHMARETRPDLITMDLTMPRMDGEACIEAIAGFLPDAQILVISALSDKATALRAILDINAITTMATTSPATMTTSCNAAACPG